MQDVTKSALCGGAHTMNATDPPRPQYPALEILTLVQLKPAGAAVLVSCPLNPVPASTSALLLGAQITFATS